jgi:hypothetical protein
LQHFYIKEDLFHDENTVIRLIGKNILADDENEEKSFSLPIV